MTSNAIDPDDLSHLTTQTALKEAWLELQPSFPQERIHVLPSIQHAVEVVKTLGERQVLVTGSLHLVGGLMEVAGLHAALSMD